MSDLISRKALLEAMDKARELMEEAMCIPSWATAKHCIKDMPTVDRWIPCSERRPGFKDGIAPIFNPTLVTTRNKKGGLHVTTSNFCILTKRWLCEVENKDIKVIAWMPIPKPYEEEEE